MQTERLAEQLPDASGDLDARPSAGEILRQERLRQGLDEKEVANRLHITMHYVHALEDDKYEKLPGAVFAKGYIKSYALLLDLDPSDVLDRYAEFTSQQIEQEASWQRVRRNRDKNRPWAIISVVGFIGGFTALWAYNNFSADPNSDTPTPAVAVGSSESQPVQAAPSIAAIAEQAALAEPAESAIDVAAAATDIAAAPDQELVVPAGATSNGQQERVIHIGTTGEDSLQITFIDESFVQVNDSSNTRILRDVHFKGDIVEITGSAPFTILLENAPFTRLIFNGNEIDVSDNIRIDNSARLTVGL
jgi:cytoskeleton protein RodZ